MENDGKSFREALLFLEERENTLRESKLEKVISRYGVESDAEVGSWCGVHLKRMYDSLFDLIDAFDNVICDKHIDSTRKSGLLFSEEVYQAAEEEIKKNPPGLPDYLGDKEVWQEALLQILGGEWQINSESAEALQAQGYILSLFYVRAQQSGNIYLQDLLPIVFKVDERVHEISAVMGIWIGDNGKSVEKQLTALKKERTRKKTKYKKDWSELISLILELYHLGDFKKAANFDNVVVTVLVEVATRRKNKKISHQHSKGTISRCLTQVFDLTANNFSQPLKLVIKDKLW
jgi:hypothetical protein